MKKKPTEVSDFVGDLATAMAALNEEQFRLVKEALGENNDRQKLKTIKKILQAPEDGKTKRILTSIIPEAIVKEYVFGSLESKSNVLNIFKMLEIPVPVLESLGGKFKTFEQVRLTIEMIEMLVASGRLKNQQKQAVKNSALTNKIYCFLLQQLEKGVKSIVANQFRTKWLEFFVEVLRCVNYVIKLVGESSDPYRQKNQKAYGLAEECVAYSFMLSKEVITQLYLILLTLNRELPLPSASLNQVHYLHACTIVKGQNTLRPLLKLASELKDTEHKTQLAPILLKSFLQYFEQGRKNKEERVLDEELKQNAFDWAVSLFDVGRAIYAYLEEIIDMIIGAGGSWSLEGNYTRKFFVVKVALKYVPTATIFKLWPTCLDDCFVESGNMTMAYVTDCTETLLAKLYHELGQDYAKWMSVWIGTYKKLLMSSNRLHIRGITEFINPILLRVNSSNSLLLKQISGMPQENVSTQLGIISLIKCYKEIGKIQSRHNLWAEQKKDQKKKDKKKNEVKEEMQMEERPMEGEENPQTQFVHLDDQSFRFGSEFLLNLLISNDSSTSLQTLEFLITSKKPSNLLLPSEMTLILQFYRNCLKTSMPQYRKNYLNLTRRMLERFRKNYEKEIALPHKEEEKGNKKRRQQKATEYYGEFIAFLNELIELCFENIYPGSIFEITNPALEILLLVLNLFGPKGCEIRKGTFIEPSQFLLEKTSFFTSSNFQNLVICLESSYESIRSMAYQIIKYFDSFDEDTIEGLKRMWDQAVSNTNRLSIKSYEFACRILVFMSGLNLKERHVIEAIASKYPMVELNFCYFLMNLLKLRYATFKQQFVQEGQVYYKNLIHGVLTCFSYILDQISQTSTLTSENLQDFKVFLSLFFKQITKIMNFSVEISSENISTVVLDTLSNFSQTDKKMVVDCRGHFLPDKKNQISTGNMIGNFLDSSALISSMENEEEGIENTLVVSFYLLTREAGLVFQSIGNLMKNPELAKYIPKKQLIQLVNSYFYALVNLKHMGSVDRIANGLSKMAKVIFDQEDPDLMKIPEQLLERLLELLGDGKFTNILRRSAGVPYAFACLLKSEGPRRKILIEKTIRTLLGLAKEQSSSSLQLRIHSLNILKKLFQDSDLKQDLDMFVSQAFISSIRGFTSEEWGVRNSSLMLFSTLANRTVGIKPTFNLLEFFHKCPDLLDFISKELEENNAPTMYPPLYPIVLLLSRLLPFDLREKARITVKGETSKQMRKEELLSLQPLLRRAGDNHNYMGRVMTAKAILPFMHLPKIVPHCLQLLEEFIENVDKAHFRNNTEHYRLTQCYQLLTSYNEIVNNSEGQNYLIELPGEVKKRAYNILFSNCHLLRLRNKFVSPTVEQLFFRIYNLLVESFFSTPITNQNMKLQAAIIQNIEPTFSQFITGKVDGGDLGLSLMYKSCIELTHTCYQNLIASNHEIGVAYLQFLKSEKAQKLKDETDYKMICIILSKIVSLLQSQKQHQGLKSLKKGLSQWVSKMDITKIKNDEIIIQIISVYNRNLVCMQETEQEKLIEILKDIEGKSQNKHMKVAIFDFLLSKHDRVKCLKLLEILLETYSHPHQLEDLRQCCVLYLEKVSNLVPQLLPIYLRLLEDQEYEIRKKAAWELSRLLNIKPCNEQVVMRQLLFRSIRGQSYIQNLNAKRNKMIEKGSEKKGFKLDEELQVEFLIKVLGQNSDYEVRRKNNNQERIFCYDKPNKYRTDINNLFESVSLMEVGVIKKFGSEKSNELNGDLDLVLNSYAKSIMQRDEYQFETILRAMIQSCSKQSMDKFKEVSLLHPMLKQTFRKLANLPDSTNDLPV